MKKQVWKRRGAGLLHCLRFLDDWSRHANYLGVQRELKLAETYTVLVWNDKRNKYNKSLAKEAKNIIKDCHRLGKHNFVFIGPAEFKNTSPI